MKNPSTSIEILIEFLSLSASEELSFLFKKEICVSACQANAFLFFFSFFFLIGRLFGKYVEGLRERVSI